MDNHQERHTTSYQHTKMKDNQIMSQQKGETQEIDMKLSSLKMWEKDDSQKMCKPDIHNSELPYNMSEESDVKRGFLFQEMDDNEKFDAGGFLHYPMAATDFAQCKREENGKKNGFLGQKMEKREEYGVLQYKLEECDKKIESNPCHEKQGKYFYSEAMEEKQGTSDRVHVLVVPFPVQGHINPMLQFAKRLASSGLKITVIGTTKTTVSRSIPNIEIERIPDAPGEAADQQNTETIEEHCERLTTVLSNFSVKLIEKQSGLGCPYRVLVYDSVMPWALELAHRRGLKAAPFFTQSCSVSALYYHMNRGSLKVPPVGSSEFVEVPALPPLKVGDLPSFIYDMGSYPFILKMVVNQFLNFEKADCLLFNTFDKLETEMVTWMANQCPTIRTIGPTLPSVYLDKRLNEDTDYGLSLFNPDRESSIQWLHSKPTASVVYVSFGSLANLSETQMHELAFGLERTDSHFLWVVRSSELTKLPPGFPTAPEKCAVVNWCPQLEVLSHPAVGCFVTHCGWNSMLEALSLGVPVVAMPQWTDQTTNAMLAVEVWGVGVRTAADKKGIVRREEVEMRVREVMEGNGREGLKSNAGRWKELAREAMDGGGSSDVNIQDFVTSLACN